MSSVLLATDQLHVETVDFSLQLILHKLGLLVIKNCEWLVADILMISSFAITLKVLEVIENLSWIKQILFKFCLTKKAKLSFLA